MIWRLIFIELRAAFAMGYSAKSELLPNFVSALPNPDHAFRKVCKFLEFP